MSDYFDIFPAYHSNHSLLKANSNYWSKIYEKEDQERKKNRVKNSNILWNPIHVQNILGQKNSSAKKIEDVIFNSSLESQTKLQISNDKNKSISFKKQIPEESIDISLLFQIEEENSTLSKTKKNETKKNKKDIKLKKKSDFKENSTNVLNRTIDGFERTLQNFLENNKEKSMNRSSSNKSLENLRELQKSISDIEEEMDRRIKVLTPKQKNNVENFAKTIENQTFFTTNEELYEISFQQKN